jgi:hypothetical protein
MDINSIASEEARAVLAAAKEKRDSSVIFNAIKVFATLPASELAIVKCWIKEELAGRVNLNDFHGAVTQAKRDARCNSRDRSGLPTILTDCGVEELAQRCIAALVSRGQERNLYERNGSLARIKPVGDVAVLEEVRHRELTYALELAARYYQPTANGWNPIPVPSSVVEHLLAYEQWSFVDPIQAVIDAPVIRPDGSILSIPGYDSATRLFYKPAAGLVVPKISHHPTIDEVKSAVWKIKDLVSEFPFVNGLSGASFANFFGLLFTPICRHFFSGPTPCALIDATKPGTGKGLLSELFAVIATGGLRPILTAPCTEEEWGKTITSLLIDGTSVIMFDNLVEPLGSSKLAAALTTTLWSDRKLGMTKQLILPQLATWLVTGNNISLAGDMARRCYPIRLDARMARPETRTGFKNPNLLDYVTVRWTPKVGQNLAVA